MGLTLEDVLAAVREHGTIGRSAPALGLRPKALENTIYRNGWKDDVARARAEHAARSAGPESVEITGEGSLPLDELETLLRARGLGSKWIAKGARVGEWEQQTKEGDTVTLHSIRAEIIPTSELVLPAFRDRPKPKPILAKAPKKGKSQLGVVLSDQHIPFHDRALHEQHILPWIKEIQPDRILLPGDLGDWDMLSRHPWDARWNATMQQSVDGCHNYVGSLREVAPDAQIDVLFGNHEDRRRQRIIERLREMYGIRRAGTERSPLTLEYLLGLDDFGAVVHTDEDLGYAHSQLWLADRLVGRHGSSARKGAGASVLAELERTTHGLIMGHTHRQALVRKTIYDDRGAPIVVFGMEAGTLADVRGGLGYAPQPDWQQGAGTFTVWDDGTHECELAPVVDGTLRWRGDRW